MKSLLQRIIPLCCMVICAMVVRAQNLDAFEQFKSKGGTFAVSKVIADGAGNYYVAGLVYDSTDIGLGGSPHIITPITPSLDCGYIAKYSGSLQLLWVYRLGGAGSTVITDMVLSDNGANIILVGRFANSIDFDIKNSAQELTSAGAADGFIAKYDTAMNFIYADKIGGAGDEYIGHVALNTNGFMVVTGNFGGDCDFDPGVNTWIAKGGSGGNAFLGWYEIQNGALLTVDTFSGTDLDFSAITADNNQNIYVAGGFSIRFDVNPGTPVTTLTSAGSFDVMVAEFDYLGNLLWSDQIGGPGEDFAEVLNYEAGSLMLGVNFQGQVDFDPGAGIQTFTATGTSDAFVGQYDLTGAYQMGFALSSQNGSSAVRDIQHWGNNYYIAGSYGGTCNFNPLGSNALTSNGPGGTGFLAVYNNSGGFVKVNGFSRNGVTSGSTISEIIAIPYGEHIVVLGQGAGEVGVDFNHPTDTAHLTGGYQQFINVYDFYAIEPDTASTDLVFSNVTDSSMTVSFTAGSGTQRLVLAHKATAVDTVPTDAVYYTADTTFGVVFDLIGDSNYAVYNDTGTSFTITGLDSQTVYYFAVFEYNGQSSDINYKTDNYLTGHQQTRPFPATGFEAIDRPVFSVSPNPASEHLYLHFDKRSLNRGEVSIADMTGKVLSTQPTADGLENMTLDIAPLACGVYLCTIKTADVSQTLKFSKE